MAFIYRLILTVFHKPEKGCIIEGQIWIQHNSTEIYIDRELIQRGVFPKDIILGFRSPGVRKLLAGD